MVFSQYNEIVKYINYNMDFPLYWLHQEHLVARICFLDDVCADRRDWMGESSEVG